MADMTGKQLWSSEDYSTFNDNVGAGCWARVSSVLILEHSHVMLAHLFSGNASYFTIWLLLVKGLALNTG